MKNIIDKVIKLLHRLLLLHSRFKIRHGFRNLKRVSGGGKKGYSRLFFVIISGGRSRSTQREPPTIGKQLVIFITCGCDPNAPFL
jgi:hypothetical protein